MCPLRNYTGPQKSAGEGKGSSRVTYSKASKAYNPAIEVDDDSHSKYMSDSKRYQAYERDIEDSEVRSCPYWVYLVKLKDMILGNVMSLHDKAG